MANSLSLSPTAVASSTLATAGALATASGSPAYNDTYTQLGTLLGYGEVYGMGNLGLTSIPLWPALGAIPAPTGRGWFLDGALLDGALIAGGTWSGPIQVAISTGTASADFYLRIALYNPTTDLFLPVGTLAAPGIALTTSFTTATFVGAVGQQRVPTGWRLYLDLWANITSNSSGNSIARLDIRLPSNLIQGNTLTTPGYSALLPPQNATAYSYGGFCFNDGVNYLLIEKALVSVPVQQSMQKVARLEGVKKTGEITNERSISLKVRVIGSSRVDLEEKVDALALALLGAQQQPLTLHSADGRYFIADCTSIVAPLSPGMILSTIATLTFICQQPYAYAAQVSSSASSSLLMAAGANSTTWQLPVGNSPLQVLGGGTIYSRPTITINNVTTPNATTLTSGLTSGTPYTSLAVAALPAAATAGHIFLLVSGSTTQRVTLAANASLGATTLSVVSFTANFSYPSGSFCGLDIYLQGFSLSQNPDGMVLSVASLGAQVVGQNQALTINGDPTSATGWTVQPSSLTTPVASSGAFPVIEPGATNFYLTVTCSNQPTIQVTITWTPRWLL